MKTKYRLLGTLMVLILFSSCSSVKITDSWRNLEIPKIKGKKVMVVSKTDDQTARIRFENDLVENLNKKGYHSVESYVVFPKSSPTKELTESETLEIKKKLKNNGIDVVIVTVLKHCEEYTKTTSKNDSFYAIYPSYYGLGYYRGFYGYYGTVYMDSEPVTVLTENAKKYILETVVYDLTQPEEKQLLSVITTEVDDPQTLGTVSIDFSKKVVKELNK
ncbi:hypothetical protein D1816_22565 [Aquimarina sp. AD10]|uniref:hypothetical protein n=1 Tax=Aquimarina sp. AD10 TaxID=1714849 RepID=UPI000E4FC645|nr:hypothetical protein [Aquimarina sp. AD10]AXT63006.1 hypothetical protein D1816_22565 [Aquimarina sp. AD10]RKM92095.1 hypothetical protein D7033_21460 [Aquimarina sp. AD10]